MICQRSACAPGRFRCFFQNGGGSMSIIQRVTVAVRSVCVTSKGALVIASSPMLPACT